MKDLLGKKVTFLVEGEEVEATVVGYGAIHEQFRAFTAYLDSNDDHRVEGVLLVECREPTRMVITALHPDNILEVN